MAGHTNKAAKSGMSLVTQVSNVDRHEWMSLTLPYIVHVGTMIRPVYTTGDLAECIDKCIAAQSKGCRIAAKLAQSSNNCILYSGAVNRRNPKTGAQTAEMK